MRFRGLLIAALALAALGGGLWWSQRQETEKKDKPPADAPPNILTIAEDQFQEIKIDKGAEATQVRKDQSGNWEITAPKPLRADQDSVKSLVTSLSKLDSDRLIEEKAADLAAYGLNAPKLRVEIVRKDGKTTKLLVGDETPTGSGSFVKLDVDPRVFTIASWNKTSVDKTYRDLQDKRLLTFDSDKLSRLELTLKNQTVEFGKNNQNEWQIVRPKPLRADGGHVEELIRKLRDAKMDPAISDEDAKKAAVEFGKATPVAVARVTDAAGTQQIEVRQSKDKTYYAKSSVVEGVHKPGSDLGDGLNKNTEDFRNKKLFDFGWSDPSKVELRDGSKTYAFEKKDNKWMAGNKEMDSTSVQGLIDKLRELSSSKFLDSGFTTPVLEATVTSNEGRRVEKVLVSKAGDRFLAQRDREPSVYQVDNKAVEDIQKAAADVKPPAPPKDEKKDQKKK